MATSAYETSFYVTGGTLNRNARSYVERQADTQLYDDLIKGSFCYVLTSRQMGKSSLMVRTAVRLREESVAVAVLDLTALGQNLTVEQWYDGLLSLTGQQLGLENELDEFWLQHGRLSPLQRWMRAIRLVVLRRYVGRVVIFIDEIDAVRSLPFSTDEFFAGIREFYNNRPEDPELERLTFCLLGVATPSNLIHDTRTTPFNVGRRIELYDFNEQEAQQMARGLGRDPDLGKILLKRTLHWTGGHPYLTQRLCQSVAQDPSVNDSSGVDRVCEELFLSARAREQDDNLLFVRERLVRSELDFANLLEMYRRIHLRKVVRDDDANPLVDVLRLSGITTAVDGRLVIRNRIYDRVFDKKWITANMPDAELRRQRAAYRRGLLRATAVAAIVLAIITFLTIVAIRQRNRAEAQNTRAEKQETINRRLLYAAQMNLALQAWERGDIARVLEFLDVQIPKVDQEDLRGFEWYYLWRLCHDGLLILGGEVPVESVAFSPDGQMLATGSDDRVLRLLDATTGQELATFKGHTKEITCTTFSPDGRKLATASRDKSAKLWDVASARELLSLNEHAGEVYSVTFSPDGRTLATAGEDSVKLWDVSDGRLLTTIKAHTGVVNTVAFSPNGEIVASGGGDKVVNLWDIARHRQLAVLKGHKDFINYVAFSSDGRSLASASDDRTVKLWDVATRRELTTLRGHVGQVTSVAFAPGTTRLATASYDRTVRLWDLSTSQELTMLRSHASWVTSVAFSSNGTRLASASYDNTVQVRTLPVRQEAITINAHSDIVRSVMFSPDGNKLATGSYDNSAKLWDATTKQELATLKGHTGQVSNISFSPEGNLLATASQDKTAKLWDVSTGNQLMTLTGHTAAVTSVAFSPDGKVLATGSHDKTVKLWDVTTGLEIKSIQAHPEPVLCLAFSPDGRILATGSDDNSINLLDLGTGDVLATLTGHIGYVSSITFSPDGKWIASGSQDKTIKLWEVATRTEAATLKGHTGWVISVAFTPDGKRIASGGLDNVIKLWDLVANQELGTFKGHEGYVSAVAFSPNARMLVSASQDHTVKIWEAAAKDSMTETSAERPALMR